MTAGPRLDLHVHSRFSADGRVSVEELVGRLAQLGLGGLALTDHNSTAGLARLAELRRERPGLVLVPGLEVSTPEGHLLVYGVEEGPPTPRSIDATIDWCVAQGGVAVPAHPFRRVHGVGAAVAGRLNVPAVETVNGHNGPRANRRAQALAAQRALGTTGGSDGHAVDEVGRAWTRFPEGVTTLEGALDALRRGKVVAEGRSAGPLSRLRLGVRSFGLRLGRGMRQI
jgi:predicted metal-dependent phosphoesterase TrpH